MAETVGAASPYQTALRLGHKPPTHVAEGPDRDRVTAYWTYEDMYNNDPGAFAGLLTLEEGEDKAVRYVPHAVTIIEATNRYLARGFELVAPPVEGVTTEQTDEAVGILQTLFDREEFTAKFLSAKRWSLVRGDAILHITVDPLKEPGTRLRITEVDPACYFPIVHPVDRERVIGAYLVTIVLDDEDEEIAQRIEYRRILTQEDASTYGAPLGSIYTRLTYWETEGWDDRIDPEDLSDELQPPAAIAAASFAHLQGFALEPEITSIPLYHFRNKRQGASLFGTSELQGVESLLSGITQTTTDQDLTVGLQGVGLYWTDSGKPTDRSGNAVPWRAAPGVVWELEKGGKVGRVDGATTIDSLLNHTAFLQRSVSQATGTPDIAAGKVDVQVASSGVALAIEMAPITAKNEEKELELAGKLNQMLFDLLNGWLPAYEDYKPATPLPVIVKAEFADPMPIDAGVVIQQITQLVVAKVISAETGRVMLAEKLGWKFPANESKIIADETAATSSASLDPFGQRLDAAGEAPPVAEEENG